MLDFCSCWTIVAWQTENDTVYVEFKALTDVRRACLFGFQESHVGYIVNIYLDVENVKTLTFSLKVGNLRTHWEDTQFVCVLLSVLFRALRLFLSELSAKNSRWLQLETTFIRVLKPKQQKTEDDDSVVSSNYLLKVSVGAATSKPNEQHEWWHTWYKTYPSFHLILCLFHEARCKRNKTNEQIRLLQTGTPSLCCECYLFKARELPNHQLIHLACVERLR